MTRVLLIEDDTETAQEIIAELCDLGYVADWTENGIEGLDRARTKGADVLIVDRMLPGMDGLSVIDTLRREDVRTPVLVLREVAPSVRTVLRA